MSEPAVPNLNALRLEADRLRIVAGLSYEELASRTGLDRRSVIKIFRAERTGELVTWWNIARGLGVPLSELVQHLDEWPTPFRPS